ncbi:hypothetical protein [Mycobacterium sp. DL]|uniref:hypothetical protein n=1 Tax=Mycobacterium sp. DL TaxID=3145017 RepID=UPI00321B81AF
MPGATPPAPPVPPSSTNAAVNNPIPPYPPAPPSSVGANTGTPQSPIPGTPGSSVTVGDLLTPPGLIRTVQDGASSVAGALPPPPAPVPGAAGAVNVGVPATPDPFTPLAATGLSNLIAPPPLNIPSIPGLPVPLPNEIPVPSDLLCIGTDWSASQGDSAAPAVNVDIPKALVTGADPVGDRRDRWDN